MADDLSDFSNDLATDIGPLIVLFGESMTKQYLSESTSFLDYFIFAMAPIGIITAIVSTIRVCGHPSLRAFIGRSQEGDGAVEAELCTSTSRDVCELFNRGGITRVLGKPNILELIYLPRSRSLDLLQNYLRKPENTEDKDSAWWQRDDSSLFGKAKDPAEGGLSFAPNPNLSLNVGIIKRSNWVLYTIAAVGFVLQAGVLALAGTGVWILGWNLSGAESSASRDYAPVMFITGTVLMCAGMWSCAALIGQTTHELHFRRTKRQGLERPRLLWLQPGPQVIGDQSFDPFAYFEDTDTTPLQVWTSSRKDFDEKFETYTLFAVLAVLIGYIMQFIGLRGMMAWVSLAQLGITIVMSILRGCLRMQRLGRNDNMLLATPDMVAGHELDWLSFAIVEAENRAGGWGKGEKTERKRRERGGEEKDEGDVPSWHVTGQFEDATHPETEENTQLTTKPQYQSEKGLGCTELLLIRKQLAHLTGNVAFGTASGHQEWEGTRVKVRAKAVELGNAISQAAERLWKRRLWKHRSEDIPHTSQREQDTVLRIRAVASPPGKQANSHKQLIDVTLKPPNASEPDWKMDSAQLEAILGLWMWTLLSDKRVVSEDDSHQKTSRAEKVQCMRTFSAGLDRENRGRGANKQGEMDLWLGPNAVPLLENSLTLTEQSCNGIDSASTSTQQGKQIKLRVQITPVGGSLLDICAQELFTSLAMSLMSILTVERTTMAENAGWMRLGNPTVATFARAFMDHDLGSYSEALLCLVPAFRTKFPPPSSEDMLPALLQTADTYRKASEWDRAQTTLRWACARHAPNRGEEEENPATAPGSPESPFTRALRATGELYRWSLAQHSSVERKLFGKRGIEWMAKTYRLAGPSNPRVTEILDCYETVAQRITTGLPDSLARLLVAAMRKKKRTDTLHYLCFVKTGDFASEALQPVLPLAVENDWSEVVNAVLEMKADPNSQDEYGQSALFLCAVAGRESDAKFLLDLGAFANRPDGRDETPLLAASRLGHLKVVELLSNSGSVDIDSVDRQGHTALSRAAEGGHDAVVRALLEKGAKPTSRDSHGRSPLSYAAESGNESAVKLLLLKDRAMLESADKYGRTPLSIVVVGHRHRTLLRAGMRLWSDY
ncbi:uncharacterized protein B0H64DRAFT_437346 [Chaetomium fimeti]|uniref:Ankyrin repeat protein n=1 Tax=Chaetomium fimeti TaxID=1854472 RepID=A0AAE0LWH6_9PEZI|nr:hypothetical protein B0H64DRAFT_437346 [Chaetomium fimeti]